MELRRIVLIDDERLLTLSAQRLLQRLSHFPAGWDTILITANSGREAQERIAQAGARTVGCVIIDASLPDIYGLQLIALLQPATYPALRADCYFIVWSSWECQQQAREAGAHGYISKTRSQRRTFPDDLVVMLEVFAADPQRQWHELGPFD